MTSEQICPSCGKAIPFGQKTCAWCTLPRVPAFERDVVLLLSLLGLLVMFGMTGFAARMFHSKERALGEQWFKRGESDLTKGNASAAVEDLRSALAYSQENPRYRLRLAQALVAAHRPEEARSHLLNLWDRQPGDGTVNLELAHLAAGQGNVADAVRYFHNAIFGVWPENPEQQRRLVRLELCEFLLARGLTTEAQAALLELAADLPRNPALHSQVGDLFMRASDYSHALKEFQQALGLNGKQEDALLGAGRAAFQLEDYQRARRYLDRAVRLHPDNKEARGLAEMVGLILSIDPLERRLPVRERVQRAIRAFTQATARLQACAEQRNEILGNQKPETPLQQLQAQADELRPKMRVRTLERNADLLASVVDLVFEIEGQTAPECGPPTGLDQALFLIAQKRGGTEP